MSGLKRLGVPLVLVLLVAAAGWTMFKGGDEQKTLTAHFPRTISIYEGSEVKVLGVAVGNVDQVTPSGTDVVVTMSYDPEIDLPADAKAVIVAPSIVGDRYVQITPVYESGPKLADGATLKTQDTSVPLELDQIYSSLNDLNVALGPNGANREGALSDLLNVTAENFGGQGASFNQTIQDFSSLTATLDDNKEELFGSAAELQGFLNTLATNDQTVRQFNQSLSSVSDLLSGEKEELAAALKNLSVGARRRRDVRQGQPRHPRQEHRAHQPGGQGAGQAARRARRDAPDGTAGPQQPGADLQPAGRHARHQRQPRRAGQPDHLRPGAAGVQHPQPGRQDRLALPDLRRPAQAGGAVLRQDSPLGTGSSYGQAFDPSLGGLVADEGSAK